MTTTNLNSAILGLFSGNDRSINIPKLYIELTGAYNRGNVLNQCVFYSNKSSLKDGWFYKTYQEWTEETLISESTLRRIFNRQVAEGWIEKKSMWIRGIRKLCIRPNIDKIIQSIKKLLGYEDESLSPSTSPPVMEEVTPQYVEEENNTASGQIGLEHPVKLNAPTIYTDKNKQILNPYSPFSEEKAVAESNPIETPPFISDEERLKTETFELFWKEYPRKEGKKPAYRAWKKQKCYLKADEIIAQVQLQVRANVQWEKGKYVPMPATWLNQERWHDEIPEGNQTTEYYIENNPDWVQKMADRLK